nr:hypothetical protein [Tanacetum cinerariifolium]
TESDGVSEEEETTEKEEESFDLIPRTPEDGKDDGNGMESIFTTCSSTVTPIPSPKSTMTPSIITTTTIASQPPILLTPIPSDIFPTLPTFASVFRFEDRVKSLEVNFYNIPGIVHQYMHQQMPEAVREAVQIQTDRLQDSIQRENDEFLRTIDDNMKKIIKEQAKILTRSSYSSRTSYAVAADLSEIELKKILIDKMEGNKSIQRSDEQRNLYKRRREGGEHASASTPSELATGSAGRSTTGTQSR